MKVLIYGDGYIASFFKREFMKQKISFMVGLIRVEEANRDLLRAEILAYNPTHILCSLGRTHGPTNSTVDYLQGKMQENLKDNLWAPLLLHKLCRELKVHYTYLGTGCIYSGGPYSETDAPNFFGSEYSLVKGIGDQYFLNEEVLNLRLRLPISSVLSPRNLLVKLLTYRYIYSTDNSITVLDSMIPIAVYLMREKTVGTFNFTNPGSITHNEILTMYKEMIDPSISWVNCTAEEHDALVVAKRSVTQLNTDKLTRLVSVPPVREALREMFMRLIEK